jgi:hypothetical protein
MFITHSFTAGDRAASHIVYLPEDNFAGVPAGTPAAQVFYYRAAE